MSVLIGMPCGSGNVPLLMVQSLLELRKPVVCGFTTVERQRIDRARNIICGQMLAGDFEYLMFVDDDNPIPTDSLELLLADDKDVVSAIIPSRNPDKDGKHQLCCFYSKLVDVDNQQIRLYESVVDFKEDGNLHKVDALGTGCVLIKRKVIEKLFNDNDGEVFAFGEIRFDKPVVIDGIEYKKRTMSEDCEFSERATDAGFELWIDERVRPIHLTQQGFVKYGTV